MNNHLTTRIARPGTACFPSTAIKQTSFSTSAQWGFAAPQFSELSTGVLEDSREIGCANKRNVFAIRSDAVSSKRPMSRAALPHERRWISSSARSNCYRPSGEYIASCRPWPRAIALSVLGAALSIPIGFTLSLLSGSRRRSAWDPGNLDAVAPSSEELAKTGCSDGHNVSCTNTPPTFEGV
jgi:hypothetical protein